MAVTQSSLISNIVKGHEEALCASFDRDGINILEKMVVSISDAFKRGNKLMLCGNGGSAADAQHIAAEFIVRFKRERKSLPAIALTTDTSVLTAVGNDYGYERLFERQIEGLGQKGDVLLAFSTSGSSKNVILAAKKAKELGLKVLGFSGKSGGDLKKVCDCIFLAGSEKTPHIQEMHITALHAVSEAVEDMLFANG